MARNGSGTYSLPSGNPVVTGTTISSTWANNTLNDIATALTQSVSADGQTPITANIPMGSHKITGLANGTVSGDALHWGQIGTAIPSPTGTGASGTWGINITGSVGGVTFSGTASTTMTLPSTSQTLAALGVGQSFSKAQVGSVYALTVTANAIAVDMSLSNNFSVTLQATTAQTLSNPTNTTPGQKGTFYITQNATPSTLTFGTNWIEDTTGNAPTVSTTASAQNELHYSIFDSTHIYYVLNKHGVA